MDRDAAQPSAIRAELTQLLKLSWPVVLSRLGIMAMGLCDALVVGRYSATQLGYHALGWAPTSVIVTMVIGLLSGVQVMTARAAGEGRQREAGAVLRRGLAYSLWIGLVSAAALMLCGPLFMHSIGLDRDLADGAGRVMLVFCLSLPAYALSTTAGFWLEGLSRPGPGAWAMWIANGVNLALDLLLVPGTFGLPAMGAMGGAWATTGARTFLTVLLLVYIARMPEARDMGVFERPPRDRPAEAEQRRIGFGAGVSNFFEVAAFASMNLIAGWAGGMAVAAWAIVLNIMSVIFMVPLGLATGAAIRVGLACGARNPQGVARAGLVAFGVTAAFGGAISLIVWPSAARLAHAYTSDPATLALAIPALAIVGLALLPDALQVVVAQCLRARGDIWLPSGTHLASYMLIMMPLAWYLAIPRGLGVVGLVWAIIAASLMACGLLLGRFWQLTRRDTAITNA